MADHTEIVDRLSKVEAVVGGVMERMEQGDQFDTRSFSRLEAGIEKIDQKLDRTLQHHDERIRRVEYVVLVILVTLTAAGVKMAGPGVANIVGLFTAAAG